MGLEEEWARTERWRFGIANLKEQGLWGFCQRANKLITIDSDHAFKSRIADVQQTIFHEIAHALDRTPEAIALMAQCGASVPQVAAELGIDSKEIEAFVLELRKRRKSQEPFHGMEWARQAVRIGVLPNWGDPYRNMLSQALRNWTRRQQRRTARIEEERRCGHLFT